MNPTIALYLPAAAPAVGALIATLVAWPVAARISALSAMSVLTAGAVLATRTHGGGDVTAGLLRADALTAYLLIAVGAVATIACWAGVAYLRHEIGTTGLSPRGARRYLVLVQLFLVCMSLAVLADNLGLVWIAIEATTIVTAFLVGYRRTRESIEAAWKYVVLCSVGIGIAFLGTICVYAASVATGARGLQALDWTYLSAHAHELDAGLMRLAAGLVLLGFGTKAGLAPMHAWLPDAHSQAPAPVSALMSGVLLSVAFYAILRYKTVTDAVLGTGYVRSLLLVAALGSLTVAALLLLAQRDYKRMLAYSSIEHMGVIALGSAIGGRLALSAALLHILGHGLAKSVAFCSAGRILHLVGSARIDAVRGLAARTPALAAYSGLAVLALLGFPPFALFPTELGIARAGLAGDLSWAVVVAVGLTLVAFAAITRHTSAMLLGPPPSISDETSATTTEPAPGRGWTPLALGLAAAAALGIWLGPLQPVLDTAARIAGGS
jgi:hydrogenase-4 component F